MEDKDNRLSESELKSSKKTSSSADVFSIGEEPEAGSRIVDLQISGDSSIESTGEKSGIVAARGTGEGLILRLDGRVERKALMQAVKEYVTSRKGFLAGNEVVLEWVGKKPEAENAEEVSSLLAENFNIVVKTSRLRDRQSNRETAPVKSSLESVQKEDKEKDLMSGSEESKSMSLFGGIEALGLKTEPVLEDVVDTGARVGDEAALWDDPDTRTICGTLRSGQKIETEHSLVVLGDVNSGAEIIAGGDIIVLGKLRGVAHAGAYDETGGGRLILSLELQPTQLRIGSVISRGSEENGVTPEVARVDGNNIIVEPYSARSVAARRSI